MARLRMKNLYQMNPMSTAEFMAKMLVYTGYVLLAAQLILIGFMANFIVMGTPALFEAARVIMKF